MEWLAIGAVAAGALVLFLAFMRSQREARVAAARTVDLAVNDEGVHRRLADGRSETVAWDEIIEVEVITTDIGVHRDDGVVLVLAAGPTRGCLVPSQMAGGVIPRLHRLPGFDARRLADAMALPPPSRTSCWTRPGVS